MKHWQNLRKMKIIYAPKFLRSFEKLPKDIQDLFRLKEIIFRENPFDSRLGTHKLKDKIDWSFSVTHKIRVIFIFKENIYILINIGDHSIYRNRK